MIGKFSARHGAILQDLLAQSIGSIIVKTDQAGFIEDASPGLDTLGIRLSELLFKPHVADLSNGEHAEALRSFHQDALAGTSKIDRVEFPVPYQDGEAQWFALSLRPVPDSDGVVIGALGIIRSIEERRGLEGEIANASMTDSSTGLANDRAFRAMLAHMLAKDSDGAVALFEVDRFSTIRLRYGDGTAQEMLWAFGQYLENMLQPDHVLARMDEQRFAVLLPHCSGIRALETTQDILATFSELSRDLQHAELRLTASAGVAAISGSLESVLVRAERALVVARALGGQRAELRDDLPRWKLKPTGS